MKNALAAVVAALLALAAPSLAAYLEADTPAQVVGAPRDRWEPANPFTYAVRGLTVRDGCSYRGLTVFPLETDRVRDATNYVSLEEALDRGELVVTEKGSGSVPVLVARNVGDDSILLVAGEVLVGGKQNRVLRDDVLLEPGMSADLPVLCVERGRWQQSDETFSHRSPLAALSVRSEAQGEGDQAAVWESVSEYSMDLRVPTKTGDLHAVQDAPEVRAAIEEYAQKFGPCWRSETVGMVVARFGRIVGADVFCNQDVFRKHRECLLASYVIDCCAKRDSLKGGLESVVPDRREAEQFLRRALEADYEWHATPGAGRLLTLHGHDVRGSGLVSGDVLLHGCLFGREDVVILPRPSPPPMPPVPLRDLE